MNYITSIKTAILIFPSIALLFTIPFILLQYHKYGSIHKFRSLIVYSFILYLIIIYFLVILPLPDPDTVTYQENRIRLIPFQFVSDFIKESSFSFTHLKIIKEPCFYTVIFNIFMTIPFGMYLRYYFRCSMKKTMLFSFLLSLFFELTQLSGLYFIYEYPYRVFDVDDLLLNTLGGVVGYYALGLLKRYLPTREKIDEDSFIEGKKVSGFRRITIFFLDLFLYVIFLLVLLSFFKASYLPWLLFVFYYLAIPYLLKERTLGSMFLNVQFDFPNHKKIRYAVRTSFLLFYYFILPHFSFWLTKNVSLGFLFLLLLCFLYLRNIFKLLHKGRTDYDNLLKVDFISTIKEKK